MNIDLNTAIRNDNIKSLNNNQGVLNNKNNVIDGKTLNLSGNILDEKKTQAKKEAMKLIVRARFTPIIEKIEVEEIKKQIVDKIDEKLN